MARRTAILLSLVALGLLLFGCVNYEQTVKMEPTGAGEAEIYYWFQPGSFSMDPTAAPPSTEADIKSVYEQGGMKVSNIKVESKTEKDAEDNPVEWTHVSFALGFDSVSSLALVGLGDLGEVTDVKWEETPDGYTFTEEIIPSPDFADQLGMTEYHVTFAVNMPGKILSASDPGKIDGSKVTWSWDLDSYSKLGAEFTLTCTSAKAGAEVAGGMGVWLWVIIGIVVVIIIIVIIIIVAVAGKKKK